MQPRLIPTAPSDARKLFVYLDFCFYAYCNFTCTYCRDSNAEMSKGSGRESFERAIADFLASNSAAILKLSGYGEATLWPELADAVASWADRFPTIQLISNGAGPPNVYRRLCQLDNFQASITLDGHTPEADRFRTKGDAGLHRKVIDTIDRVVAAGRQVEINCVITKANAGVMEPYLNWMAQRWGQRVCVIPLPVRPTLGRTLDDIRDDLVATDQQMDQLEEVFLDRYTEFHRVLAPRAYLEAMLRFMRTSRRSDRCHVHRANFGVNTEMLALACACAGDRLISPLGNIRSVGVDEAVERRQQNYLRQGNVGEKCRTCFTHYDVLNLYFDGTIPESDLSRIPSLSNPETIAHLRAIRQELAPFLQPRPPAAPNQ